MKRNDVKVGDLVHVYNVELGRPEQADWIGTLLELEDLSLGGMAVVLWNTGSITRMRADRLRRTDKIKILK